MNEHTAHTPGMTDDQAEQLPSLAERSLEEIESVAEVLVEVRSISSQLSTGEVKGELGARLDQVGIRLPDRDLEELANQLAPARPGEPS